MSKIREVIGVTTLAIGLGAGCSAPQPEVQRDLPNPSVMAEAPPAPELPDCVDYSQAEAIGPFAVSSSESDETEYFSSAAFVEAHPDLSPRELVDQFMAERSTTGLQIIFDEGAIEEEWDPYYNIFSGERTAERQSETIIGYQKTVLIDKVEILLYVFSEYSPEFLAFLGVNTVRIANNYDYFAGHYDRDANEVLIEFDVFSNGLSSVNALRKLVAHEAMAHPIHNIICGGNLFNDKALAEYNNGFEYIDSFTDNVSEAEQEAHYGQIPDSLLEIGPERTFARHYGAVNSAEDFATIVEFTLEERGLILPADPDYDSPLAKKQSLIVDRIEQFLPGFRAFSEARTRVLRRRADSELNVLSSRDLIVPEELIPSPSEYDPNVSQFDYRSHVAVLNGAAYVYESDNRHRGGKVALYPMVELDPSGKITQMRNYFLSMSGVGGLEVEFLRGDLSGGDIVVVPWEEYERLQSGFDVSSPEADAFFAERDRQLVISATE